MPFERHNSDCANCPLRDRTRVWGQGSTASGLAFIGEAPGETEDIEGTPFAGRAGKFLDWGLANAGIRRSAAWFTNVACCRPPKNDIGGDEGVEACTRCSRGFSDELEYLRRAGVRVLIPLGNTALRALGLDGSITKVRGSVYQAKDFTIVPTFHPSFVMRSQHKKEGAEVTYKYVWIADLTKAKGLVEKAWVPPAERFCLSPAVADVHRVLSKAIADKTLLGVDIETTGRGDRTNVVVVGIATSGEEAISIPFMRKGGYPYWSTLDEIAVREIMNEAFTKCPLAFQNAMFDVPILQGAGFAIDFANVAEDTMVLHHAVSPELPHNLGFIVSIYGETPFWKDIFADRRGSVLEMADEDLRTYNLRDAVVLHQILPGLHKDLEEIGGMDVYRKEALRLLAPVSEMTQTGFAIKTSALEVLKRKWIEEREAHKAALRIVYPLPETFNLDSDDELRWFLFRREPAKFKKLSGLREYDETTKTGKKARRKDTKAYRELLAIQALRDLKSIYSLTNWTGRTTETGMVAVDKQGLLAFQIQLQNRLAQIADYKHDKFKTEAIQIRRLLEWLRIYRDYSGISKLISTYTDYPVGPDGRVHASFLVHGTATGRLSSRGPNLQNLPKKRVEAREPFVAREGCVLVSADYSNLEVRVLAYEANDEPLIKALEAGINVHDENTKILFNLTPKDPEWEMARRAAKIFMFGGLSYGGSDNEIHQKIAMEVPQLALTRSEYTAARSRWMAGHAGYTGWSSDIRANVHNTKRAVTFRGRTRTLHGSGPSIEKEALNTPIQGGAAHIVNEAMIRLYDRRNTEGLHSKLIAQVHDQLIFEVPNAEIPTMKAMIQEEMERPVDYRGRAVTFPVDISIGTSWGSLKEGDNPDGDSDAEGV